jgi:hypothetical protein
MSDKLDQPDQPQPPLPPDTTYQQDLVTAGQRKVNLIWEVTQALIALTVVGSTMAAAVVGYLSKFPEQIPTVFSLAFGTVVGFYFGRTNHERTGGVGPRHEDNRYTGR